MNKIDLIKQIDDIDGQIEKIVYDGRSAIKDGIVNLDNYLSSELKIMWILREVNSSDDEGNWDMRDVLMELQDDSTKSGILKGWSKTFNPIIYTTYGIFNKILWGDIPDVSDDNSIVKSLQNIAYINLKKVSGLGTSKPKEITSFFREHSQIIIKQILTYNPDVIICGGTGDILDETLDEIYSNFKEKKNENGIIFYLYDDVILVYAQHPNYVGSYKKEMEKAYCDTIIKNVLEWKEKYKK